MSWPQESIPYSAQLLNGQVGHHEEEQPPLEFQPLSQDYLGLYQIPLDMNQPLANIEPQPNLYQPPLAFDPHYADYQQLPSHPVNPPVAAGFNTYAKGEIVTPDVQYDFQQYSMTPTGPQPIFFPTPMPQAIPDYTQFNMYPQTPGVPLQHQGTISPSQLSSTLKPNPFTGSFMESRASTSSASSTDDWNRTGLDDFNPLQQALITEIRPTPPIAPVMPMPLPVSTDPKDTAAVIREYLLSPNRLAHGERKIVIMTPKVGQKSYGTEKRFMCPHPQVALYGTAWWTLSGDGCPVSPIHPPRVNVSFSGEAAMKDAPISWTTVDGRNLDEGIKSKAVHLSDRPFAGNIAGKSLHISDADGKRKEVRAMVTVRGPLRHHAGANGWGRAKGTQLDMETGEVLGTFESKDIKVISKPSKKKSNTKSGELVIQHGSTVALFNRTKAQTTSTRYLSVPLDLTAVRGSDGQHVDGARPPISAGTSIFDGITASASVWESFIIYLVDPTKTPGVGRESPAQRDWPPKPNNAVTLSTINPPIRYNSLVVLQSLQTGHCTPTLVIRRVDQDAEVVGCDGSVQDHSGAVPEGEMAGDMVSQLQKVAFEVYQPGMAAQMALSPSLANSHWLACDQDNVTAKHVKTSRRWAVIPTPQRAGSKSPSMPNTPTTRHHVLPMTPHTTSAGLPLAPSAPSSPISSGSSLDYFGSHSRKSSSTALSSASMMSPMSSDHTLPSAHDAGPVRRQRTGSTGRASGPMGRPAHRKRMSTDNSASSSWEHLPHAAEVNSNRQFWTMDVGDVCVWTIVNTEQVTYTFYTPPSSEPIIDPIAPFPVASKHLPPSAPADHSDPRQTNQFTSGTDLPLVSLYGKGFSRAVEGQPKYQVWYGDQPARYNEARCEEVMAAAEPISGTYLPVPILLVRNDGRCILPTGLEYRDPSRK